MLVEDLARYGIPEKYIEKMKEEKVRTLYPPQAQIVEKGLFKGKNLILSLPTASGKTLIATMAMVHTLSESGGKVVYISPLVALAYEKHGYFKNFFGKDYKTGITVGDYDSSDQWLGECDIICMTTEKFDSILRHNVQWVNRVRLVIVDEIHMIDDPSRGPTLEVLITKLKMIIPHAQVLGLSATISNADELAKWINATLVVSDFRPVKLYEGVSFNSRIHFNEKDGYDLDEGIDIENSIVKDTMRMNKQVLMFTSTRKNAESLAERLCQTTKLGLKKGEEYQLQVLSDEIESILELPTRQCRRIANCIKSGVAFHHAGLLGQQKRMIEENFKKGLIKAIAATPTLALGVNLPAFRVLIRDAKRYYAGVGSMYIPVMEYKQFVGRAGRPTYDSFGESILLAKTEGDAKDLIKHYIYGEPEKIRSKLASEPALRMHILSLIASGFCNSKGSLTEFFSRTFYAHQYSDMSLLEEHISEIVKSLSEWRFVVSKGGIISATIIGRRISELYLDPLTGKRFVDGMAMLDKRKVADLSFMQLLSNCIEMKPLLSVGIKETEEVEQFLLRNRSSILEEIPEEFDTEFEDFMRSVKMSMILEGWIHEMTEEQILSRFNVAPGEMTSRLRNVDWLLYALHEVALLEGHKDILSHVRKLRVKTKYGIKEELIPLVKLEGIGRVRARKLFNAGLESLEKLKRATVESLSRLLGTNIANSVKKQLGEKHGKIKEEKQATLKKP
ncbi:MAG: DEAD/DEAH box helicase [Candidatus Aenigmarchaeota archaeon]|nr:DEAD/DEAH box helicase [Candidatus Aenigmarchaeota archaeon]